MEANEFLEEVMEMERRFLEIRGRRVGGGREG
jgi:hypothetical protein